MNRLFFIASILICFGMSCTDVPKGFSENERILLDSLFNSEKVRIQGELDSLCIVERERLFNRAIDSISRQRIAEINQIIN